MLITYADSMGNNLKDLHKVLNQYYAKAVGGVHIPHSFHPLPTVALLRCVMIGLTRTSEHLQM